MFLSGCQKPDLITPDWYILRGGPEMDEGWGVTQDSEGNLYFLTHDTTHGPFPDITLYKINPSDGSEIWNTTWGGEKSDMGYEVVTQDDLVFIGGATDGPPYDMLIQAYYATNGTVKWTTVWGLLDDSGGNAGNDEVDGIVVDGDYLYIAGWATVPNHSNDIGILKLNKHSGKVLWNITWGTEGWDEENGEIVVDDTTIYVAGRYNVTNMLTGGEALLAAFSKTNGTCLHHVTWLDNTTFADYLGMTGGTQFLYTVGIAPKTGEGDRIILHKYDKSLNLIWAEEWKTSGSEASRMVQLTPTSDALIVAGKTSGYTGKYDFIFLKYNLQGALLWVKSWGGSGDDEIHGLALSNDNTLYIAGQTTSYGKGKADAILAKFILNE